MKLSLRKVLKKDWDYILELRNNKKFKKNFYQQHEISKKEHYEYLKKQLNNANFFNWIICYGEKNVGYIRILDYDVGIIIDENYQKKGFGREALELLEIESKKIGLKKLVGKIMIDNINSKKIFEKNDFKLKMFWYEKNIE